MIEEVFWIVLGRAPSPWSCATSARRRATRAPDAAALLARVSDASNDLEGRQQPGGRRAARERGCGPSDRTRIRAARVRVPARPPGRRERAAPLHGGARGGRDADELFARSPCPKSSSAAFGTSPRKARVPRDTQLCELANPAKWDNPEWLDLLRSLGLSDDKLSMHRKPYEFTQLIFGCRRLGVLREDAQILSVGAGHEHVLYWLANHVRRVVATDMYEGVWQDAAARKATRMCSRRPEDYAPFPYRRDHLIFMKMDGRRLAFRDGAFDIAYSLSSIEHFGGMPERSPRSARWRAC